MRPPGPSIPPSETSPARPWIGFEDATWRTGAFRALAIGLLAGSTVVAPVAVLRAVSGWRLDYAFPLAVFAGLLGVITTLRLGRPELRDRRGVLFRLGEILLLLVLTRLSMFMFSTGWPTAADLGLWLRHPGAFLSAQMLFIGLLVVLAWVLAVAVTSDFQELAIQSDEVAARESHAWGEPESHYRAVRPVSRQDILVRFATRWTWGGLPMVLLAGLSRVNITEGGRSLRFGLGELGLPPDVLVGMLCYFLAGLFLLSDARLAVLRGQWYNQRVEVAAPVFRRWHWNSLLVLLAVAAVALLLPIGSTGPLTRALEWLLALLVRAGMVVSFLLSALLSLLLYPLRWLFADSESAPAAAPAPLELPTQTEMVSQMQIPDWVRGAVVWVVVALVGGYLLFNFLRGHGLLRGRWFAWAYNLRYWWRARKSQLDAALQSGLGALRERLRRSRAGELALGRPRRARLDRMAAREKVRYYYLRAAERAADRGLGRPAHKTPLEYERDLETAWPDAETDVHELTEAFLDARYAPRDIAETEVSIVQETWRRVMKALRRPTGPQDRAH